MNVSGATSASPSPLGAGRAASTGTDHQTFLKLLVEQIRNQDPTNPVSSTDMLAQLASFSSVEQQTITNAKLEALSAGLGLVQSASLVGMRGTSLDGTVDGQIVSIESVDGQYVATLHNGTLMPLSDQVRISRYDRI
jgi:flagellar basal-body rod modification protein FlgD